GRAPPSLRRPRPRPGATWRCGSRRSRSHRCHQGCNEESRSGIRAAAESEQRVGVGALLLLSRGAASIVAGAIRRTALHHVTARAVLGRGPLSDVAGEIEDVEAGAALLELTRLLHLALVALVVLGRARSGIPLIAVREARTARALARFLPLGLAAET